MAGRYSTFNFDGVRPTFEKLFQLDEDYRRTSARFLLFVKDKLPFGKDPQKDEWVSAQATRMMETLSSWNIDTNVISIVRWKGLHFVSSVILPNFIGELEEVDGMAILATELVKHKEELIALPEVGGQTTNNAELLDHILDEIVEAAASRSLIHLDVVSSLLSVCITENRTSPYGKLLDALISNKLPFYCSYGKCFAEIIQILTELLREHSISVSSSPTHLFFYHIIETYLQEILGSKEGSPYLKISMLACGHEACEQVNDFMRSEETRMRSDQYEAIRKCVEYWRIGGRHNLLKIDHILKSADKELVKEHEALAAQHWDIRLADARKFLTSIGTDEEISKIMGERYLDVEKALEGSQAFVASNEDTMVGIE